MSEPKLTCNVCHKNEAIGVCSVPGVAMSCAYCKPCLEANSHPMDVLIANTACIGGYTQSAEWWREMVADSLKAQGKTLEWFNQQVDASIKEMDDMMISIDDSDRESGSDLEESGSEQPT